jgi:outer membrane lipoprotein-sorting protein
MIKRIIIFILIININTFAEASIKDEIILNFKKINNLSFNFKQNINGNIEEGNCIIQYPKKIYCNYDNFQKKIIVSNGKSLVIKNQASKQYFIYPLDKTPMELILNKNYLIEQMQKLDGKIIDDKYFNFSIQNKDNKINIFFDKNSYDLMGWQTEDIYQNLVITFVYNIEKNKNIDQKFFKLPLNIFIPLDK